MSGSVTVIVQGKTIPVTLAAGRNEVCEVKRAVSSRLGISPLLQRLNIEGIGVDSFSLSPVVNVDIRSSRKESRTLTVKLLSEKGLEGSSKFTVQVDTNDSVLDLKFILAERCQVLPDFHRLYYRAPQTPSRIPLKDGQSLQSVGLFKDGVGDIRLMFEAPSGIAGHGAIHFTRPTILARRAPELASMGDLFLNSVKNVPNRPFLGTRTFVTPGKTERGPYEWITYAQAGVRVANIVSGLKTLGLRQKESIGIMSANRSEWTLVDMSCNVSGFVSVPLYDTFGPEAMQYILNHSSIRAVVCSPKELKALASVRASCPALELLIVMDDGVNDKLALKSLPKETYNYMTLSSVEELGLKNIASNPLVSVTKAEDPLTVCYTSGTTGMPKGAVLLHGNVVAAVASADERAPPGEMGPEDITFSYLPLAHIYERVLQANCVSLGAAIGFSQGDPLKLLEDVGQLRPTIFPGVPRVWDRIYARVTQQIEEGGFIKSKLFNHAYQSKLAKLNKGDIQPDGKIASPWDGILFSKIAAAMGGRVKFMTTGAAPVRKEVAEFMRVGFLSNFVEGYGMSETCAALTCMSRTDTTYGNVGTPLDCNLIKLVDVPEMEYASKDRPLPRGEIWVSGANIFDSYLKQADATAEVFEVDGEGCRWMKTGDIGMWLPDGSLRIFDRKKAIFKLAQGEYLRPEHIEGVYKQVKEIGNVFVHGDSKEVYLVAIVYPEPEFLKAYAAANGIKGKPTSDPRVAAWLFGLMTEAGKKGDLKGFEMVKRITLVDEDFTVENGLMTPTFKLKRNIAAKQFATQITKMYAEGEGTTGKAKIKAKL